MTAPSLRTIENCLQCRSLVPEAVRNGTGPCSHSGWRFEQRAASFIGAGVRAGWGSMRAPLASQSTVGDLRFEREAGRDAEKEEELRLQTAGSLQL